MHQDKKGLQPKLEAFALPWGVGAGRKVFYRLLLTPCSLL
jgi:hypothetical protein